MLNKQSEATQSTFGILSFVIGVISILLMLVITLLDIYIVLGESNPNIGLSNLSTMILLSSPFGTIFGIIGVFEKRKKKLFPIVGLVTNIPMTLLILFWLGRRLLSI